MASDPLRAVRTRGGSAGGKTTGGAAPSARRAGGSDPRLARARELHEQAADAEALAAQRRAERDRLIRVLRAEDPVRWSYGAIAKALGCSRELVALVARRTD